MVQGNKEVKLMKSMNYSNDEYILWFVCHVGLVELQVS
jgi:hypothetical protein